MKILILCHKPPYPANDGGSLAMKNIIESLVFQNISPDVLYMYTSKHPKPENHTLLPKNVRFYEVFVNTSISKKNALQKLIKNESYHISRFKSSEFNEQLIKLLKENTYDIIHLESLFTTPYIETIRQHSKAKVVLRSHNVEYTIWEEISKNETTIIKKTYLKILSNQLKKHEINQISKYDALIGISNKDIEKYQEYGYTKPFLYLPFSINFDDYPVIENTNNNPFFIGSMDWEPNLEGIKWLIEEVWPTVYKKTAKKLIIAGRNTPSYYMQNKFEGVEFVGEVPSAKDFINQHDIMICPLFSGSGLRIKILESMALQKAVICTKKAAEGIDYTNGVHLHLAASKTEFINGCIKLIEDENYRKTLKKNSSDLITKNYHFQNNSKKLIEFYQSLLS
jgi:polysaccharide biosynthesis protein PslH